ncbi:MAG TPA: hypothetical protein VGY55_16155 [Pirellulales bacterium]|nr:hypothetical protein [Pirellulales bacterium]
MPLLCYRFETEFGRSSKRKPNDVSAIEAVLKNPSVTLADLARDIGTTEKQLRRMSLVTFAMALPIRSRGRRSRNNRRARKNLP